MLAYSSMHETQDGAHGTKALLADIYVCTCPSISINMSINIGHSGCRYSFAMPSCLTASRTHMVLISD